MEIIKFTEVLNDTINYFLLGDVITLKEYKQTNQLPDDLATEFTTSENGDKIVQEGILIPMSGIENYPYTILFNTSGKTPELLKEGNQLQLRQDGYILKVSSGKLHVFTWWILNNFTDDAVNQLIERYEQYNMPRINLENGWYSVEILGGQTMQESPMKNKQGETIIYKGLEPTFEFIITPTKEKGEFTADILKSYHLESDDY